eukprot:15256-Heterococcus_DN1.PRE.2
MPAATPEVTRPSATVHTVSKFDIKSSTVLHRKISISATCVLVLIKNQSRACTGGCHAAWCEADVVHVYAQLITRALLNAMAHDEVTKTNNA